LLNDLLLNLLLRSLRCKLLREEIRENITQRIVSLLDWYLRQLICCTHVILQRALDSILQQVLSHWVVREGNSWAYEWLLSSFVVSLECREAIVSVSTRHRQKLIDCILSLWVLHEDLFKEFLMMIDS